MQKLLSNITVSAADRKLIDSVSESIGKLGSIALNCRASDESMGTPNWRSALHNAKDAALEELSKNPSIAAAENFHAAFMRSEQAKLTAGLIADALRGARDTESHKLAAVAANVIDAAEAKVDSEAAAFKKSLQEADKSQLFNADIVTHDNRVADLKKRLADERIRAKVDPYSWLEAHALVS